MGTNMHGDKFGAVLGVGEVMSTYAYREGAVGPKNAHAEVFGGPYGASRLAFESAVNAEGAIVYGTLDLPNALGPSSRYGEFRLVIQPGPSMAEPVVMAHNTATGYGESGSFDETRGCADAATWSSRADLATARFGAQAAKTSQDAWPELLASEDSATVEADLVEVIVREERFPLSAVEAVRISKGDRDEFAQQLAEALAGGFDVDAAAAAYARLVGLVDAGECRLEVVG